MLKIPQNLQSKDCGAQGQDSLLFSHLFILYASVFVHVYT